LIATPVILKFSEIAMARIVVKWKFYLSVSNTGGIFVDKTLFFFILTQGNLHELRFGYSLWPKPFSTSCAASRACRKQAFKLIQDGLKKLAILTSCSAGTTIG